MSATKEIAMVVEERGVQLADVSIVVTRSDRDNARLILIETCEEGGHVRIDLNDGTIWDADPEHDIADWLEGFTVARQWSAQVALLCRACGALAPVNGSTLRAYMAAAKLHQCAAEN